MDQPERPFIPAKTKVEFQIAKVSFNYGSQDYIYMLILGNDVC
jgi:hypothetical protein